MALDRIYIETGGEGASPYVTIHSRAGQQISPTLVAADLDPYIDGLIADLENARKRGHRFLAWANSPEGRKAGLEKIFGSRTA